MRVEQQGLRDVLELPSETTVHVVCFVGMCLIFSLLQLMLLGQVVQETSGLYATGLVVAVATLAAHRLRSTYRKTLEARAETSLSRTWIIRGLRRFSSAGSRWRRVAATMKPAIDLPLDLEAVPALRTIVDELRLLLEGQLEVRWIPTDFRYAARAALRERGPTIIVSAGLVDLASTDRSRCELVLRHEVGHFVNNDMALFAWLLAISAAWRRITFSVLVILATIFLADLFSRDADDGMAFVEAVVLIVLGVHQAFAWVAG